MAISLSRYVDIRSSVGSGTIVPTRLLVCRMFTDNNILPPDTFIQFASAADVGTYFGLNSEEYYRSLFYFGWLSKNQTSAPAIQFSRWVKTANRPQLLSAPQTQIILNWNSITAGTFTFTLGGVTNVVSGLNFSSVTTFTEIATIIQAAIIALYSTFQGATLTSSSVTVSGLSSTSGLSVGMVVTGYGIPANTTIATIVDSTSITLNNAATISGASTLTFSLAANAQYVNSTVVFVNNSFIFTSGVAGASTISVQSTSSGQDIAGISYLGWLPKEIYPNGIFSQAIYSTSATWVNGAAAESITVVLTASQALSNNFGSFLFLNNLGLTLTQAEEAATWNSAVAQNNMYLFSVGVIAANVSDWAAGLAPYEGTALTLTATPLVITGNITSSSVIVSSLNQDTAGLQVGMPISGTGIPSGTVLSQIIDGSTIHLSQASTATATESLTFSTVQFPEQAPVMIEAATDYTNINSVQNYMFQVFPGLTPLVTADSTANSYDLLSVNYYGQTQTGGTSFNFYQRGLLFGTSSAPLDMNTYVNEIWLKDSIASTLLSLQLNLNQLSANQQGRSQVLLSIQSVINQALTNGVISVGKTITTAQQVFIGSITNSPNAWHQVQTAGYWVDCVIQPIPNVTPTQYEAVYTLIYSKDDVIRFISGADILI